MGGDARLNLLLTPSPAQAGESQPWHQTLTRLLMPLGVRTFQANSGPEAVEIIERHPIHLAVVDSRLPAISGLNVLQLIQRLREQSDRSPKPAAPPPPPSQTGAGATEIHFQMQVEEWQAAGQVERRIEVRFDARPSQARVQSGGPAVILIAPPPPQQDRQLLQEALKFNAFSVLSEPVDVNLALEIMARAMKRFHQNQWPV